MRFSYPSRFYFFAGWLAAIFGCWLLIAAGYSAQYPDLLGNYLFHALAAMLTPFVVIGVADKLTIYLYESCWRRINQRFLGPMLVDMDTIQNLRDDVREVFWFRGFAPRLPRTVKQQMQVIAQWWPALENREASFRQRFSELILDNFAFYAGIPLALLIFLSGGSRLAHAAGLGFAAATLLMLGLSMLRMAARLQAVKDFFQAWRTKDNLHNAEEADD